MTRERLPWWAVTLTGLASVGACFGAPSRNDGLTAGAPNAPRIQVSSSPIGAPTIRGTTSNADHARQRVVLWALTNVWYLQRAADGSPFVQVRDDGTWEAPTHPWQRIVAVLVDSSRYRITPVRYSNPSYDSGVVASSEYPRGRATNPIEFSGFRWGVKAAASPFDPGGNLFADDSSAVWTDSAGMHLRFTKSGDRWAAAEVHLMESLGLGVYTWRIESRLNTLSPRAVFSPFIYESPTQEIDIEFSRTLAAPANAQFVVQPYGVAGNRHTFDIDTTTRTTQRIAWQGDTITFSIWRSWDHPEPANLIHRWVYTGANIPVARGLERVHMNLWLVPGAAPVSRADEVVIRSFTFAHHPAANNR
jgi:predicted NUDIX family NTP pyrophosphohydrolase